MSNAAGILFSVFANGWQPKWNGLVRVLLFLAGYACWLLASIVCEVNADAPHMATMLQSISGWLLILAGVMCFFLLLYGSSARFMPRILVYLGRISYGMYVFHITMYWVVFRIFKDELATISMKVGLKDWKDEVGIFEAEEKIYPHTFKGLKQGMPFIAGQCRP